MHSRSSLSRSIVQPWNDSKFDKLGDGRGTRDGTIRTRLSQMLLLLLLLLAKFGRTEAIAF